MDQHVVYTNGRSGSNALTNMLKQHPELFNYGEVLGPWTTPGKRLRPLFRGPRGGTRYLDWVLGSRTAFTAMQALSYANRVRTGRETNFHRWSRTHSLGIKEFAVNFERHGLQTYLTDRPELRLIVLLRENTVERYVSVERLRQTGVVVASDRKPRSERQQAIRIDPETVLADLDRIERENELLRTAAREHPGPTMLIRYEEHYALDPAGQVRAGEHIQEFLGVRPLPLRTTHYRLRSGSLSEAIENHAEFREVVAASPYARWLTD